MCNIIYKQCRSFPTVPFHSIVHEEGLCAKIWPNSHGRCSENSHEVWFQGKPLRIAFERDWDSVWRFVCIQDFSVAWSWVRVWWSGRECRRKETVVAERPPTTLPRPLRSWVVHRSYPFLYSALTCIFSWMTYMWIRKVWGIELTLSVSSQGWKRSAFLHALICHTLDVLKTSLCLLFARL